MRRLLLAMLLAPLLAHAQQVVRRPIAASAGCDPTLYGATSWVSGDQTSLSGLSDGDPIGASPTWVDRVTGTRNWSQGTAANRPAYHNVSGPNGKSFLTFDNTNDSLVYSVTASSIFAASKGVVIAVVRSNRNGTTDGTEFGPNIYTNAGYVGLDLFSTGGNNKFHFYRYNSGYIGVSSTTTYSTGTWYVVAGWYDGTNVNIRVNNDTKVSALAGNPGSLADTPNIKYITGAALNSDIAELVTINVVNETDIATLSACYGTKYGIF